MYKQEFCACDGHPCQGICRKLHRVRKTKQKGIPVTKLCTALYTIEPKQKRKRDED